MTHILTKDMNSDDGILNSKMISIGQPLRYPWILGIPLHYVVQHLRYGTCPDFVFLCGV